MSADWSEKSAAVPYAEFSDPQSLNLYTYVRGIPTTLVDVEGHQDNLASSSGQRLRIVNCEYESIRCQQIDRQQLQKQNTSFSQAVVKTAINTLIELTNLGNQIACAVNPDCKASKPYDLLPADNAQEAKTMGQLGIAMLVIPGEGEELGAAKVTSLYARFNKEGEFLKWGITDTPLTRYTKGELAGGSLEIVTQGSRERMLGLEQWLTERAPGSMNHEPWAGSKYSERGLRAVEKVLVLIYLTQWQCRVKNFFAVTGRFAIFCCRLFAIALQGQRRATLVLAHQT